MFQALPLQALATHVSGARMHTACALSPDLSCALSLYGRACALSPHLLHAHGRARAFPAPPLSPPFACRAAHVSRLTLPRVSLSLSLAGMGTSRGSRNTKEARARENQARKDLIRSSRLVTQVAFSFLVCCASFGHRSSFAHRSCATLGVLVLTRAQEKILESFLDYQRSLDYYPLPAYPLNYHLLPAYPTHARLART